MQASVSIVLVVQSLNCVQLFETPWTAVHQASPPFTISQNLLKFMSVESMMPFNHLIPCRVSLFYDSMDCTTRLFCPWDFPGKNTGVSCHFLLQGILLT